jgi:L-2-hydroxyglutarate oxidase LhgO
MDSADVVVVGAGAIGLAVARALARKGHDTLILEAADQFGTQTSSRNSEVIHAGIYYTPGSLKARLCVQGRERLYTFCERCGVEYRRCGKLIVASSPAQVDALHAVWTVAQANGVELERVTRTRAREWEPELECAAALHSPTTGIVDSHGYMLALLGDAQHHGATLSCGSRVTRMWLEPGHVLLAVNESEPTLRARSVINCAGLQACDLARSIDGFPSQHVPTTHFVKGSYFALSGASPFQRLIYPLPEQGSLGVHLTLDLAGRARFGPDMEPVRALDYAVDAARAAAFYGAIRAYWPRLRDGALQPAYAGIRPRISAPGEPLADFRIDGPATHGHPGIVNLFGIESPGLTASLAIADYTANLIQ